MKKQQYIQPEISTMVLPERSLMGMQNSPTGEDNNPQAPAPGRGMGVVE